MYASPRHPAPRVPSSAPWSLARTRSQLLRECKILHVDTPILRRDVNRHERMCRDAREMSVDLSERLGMEKELRIWNEAVRDSFFASEPNAEKIWNKKKSE